MELFLSWETCLGWTWVPYLGVQEVSFPPPKKVCPPLTVLQAVENQRASQSVPTHGWREGGFSKWVHSEASVTLNCVPCLPTQMTSRLWVP